MVRFIYRATDIHPKAAMQFFRSEPELVPRGCKPESDLPLFQKLASSFVDLGARTTCPSSEPGALHGIPFQLDDPVCPETKLAQRFAHEAAPVRRSGTTMGLFHPDAPAYRGQQTSGHGIYQKRAVT